jgi:hypothetical protein
MPAFCSVENCEPNSAAAALGSRMGNHGKREFIQALRLIEVFPETLVAAAALDAIRLGCALSGCRFGLCESGCETAVCHSRHHNKVLSCLPSTFLGEFGKTLPDHGMPRDLARIPASIGRSWRRSPRKA